MNLRRVSATALAVAVPCDRSTGLPCPFKMASPITVIVPCGPPARRNARLSRGARREPMPEFIKEIERALSQPGENRPKVVTVVVVRRRRRLWRW